MAKSVSLQWTKLNTWDIFSCVAVDSSKFNLISGWPTPKTSKQVKSFLGVASYYRRFIARFSQISAPLRELIAKDKTFIWTTRRI